MTTNYFANGIILFTLVLAFQNTAAQVATTSELYSTIKEMDQILFENGFNQCMISDIEPLISDDLEFYHDQGGITRTKADFLRTIKQNICANQAQKPMRHLVENSLEVYPLFDKGILYGAIQNGTHEFYLKEANKEAYLTSTAKFSHLWIKETDAWKLKRVLSYDHKTPAKASKNKTTFAVSEAVLESYTGTYIGQNVKASISRKGNALQMDSGDMQLVIRPESENVFYADEAPLTFEFVKESGVISKMIVRENGKIVDEIKRVE